MPKRFDLPREDFDCLLKWLDPNEESSGARYKEMHRRLVKHFEFKGCDCAEDLADGVMDRVARYLARETLPSACPEDQIRLLFGFAKKIYSEYLRVPRKMIADFPEDSRFRWNLNGQDYYVLNLEREHKCLDDCLQRLFSSDRDKLLQYYRYEPGQKVAHRRQMALEMATTLNALRIGISRLRSRVADCVMHCKEFGRPPQVQ